MRDYKTETEKRTAFIRDIIKSCGANGIVFANSGGKDCVLTGILCKMACDNTISIMMPCESKRNFGEDIQDALKVAGQFSIETKTLDLTPVKALLTGILDESFDLTANASANIAPRLRMIMLYAVAVSENRLVAGTGNRSEIHMGYFTKWGDGAYDFNPIGDLTVTEVYEFLRFLGAPQSIIDKAPSAGLYEGQTDEKDMGISYAKIDEYILKGIASEQDKAIIDRFHRNTAHKRRMPLIYGQ